MEVWRFTEASLLVKSQWFECLQISKIQKFHSTWCFESGSLFTFESPHLASFGFCCSRAILKQLGQLSLGKSKSVSQDRAWFLHLGGLSGEDEILKRVWFAIWWKMGCKIDCSVAAGFRSDRMTLMWPCTIAGYDPELQIYGGEVSQSRSELGAVPNRFCRNRRTSQREKNIKNVTNKSSSPHCSPLKHTKPLC